MESSIAFGYQGAGTGSRSTYVDYNNFGAREARREDGGYLSNVSTGFSQTGPTGTVSPTFQAALLVTADTVGAKSAFPGVSFCNCEYTRWGFWSVDQNRPGYTASGTPAAVRDRVHMGTWVAGVRAVEHVDIPTTGTATYAGHIIGSFKTGNNEYIAAGNMSNTVNFGTNSGIVTINNLDGRNYFGGLSMPVANARNLFSGVMNSNSGAAAKLALYGEFMKNSSSAVGEMAGGFFVSSAPGVNYIGSGTFAARK